MIANLLNRVYRSPNVLRMNNQIYNIPKIYLLIERKKCYMKSYNRIVSAIMASSILLLSSCGAPNASTNDAITVIDINSDEITIPSEINRVICRSGNGTSFLVAMGMGEKLVGTANYVVTNPWADIFYPGTTSLPPFGWSPSSEEIYEVGADLVMLADPEVAGNLRADGISALCYKQYNEQEIIDSTKLMGEIFGEDASIYADKWIEYYQQTDELIQNALKDVNDEDKPTVYYIYGSSNKGLGRTDGGGSITQYWVEGAGGNFITKDLSNDGPKITEEEAIKRNPDVILIGGIYSSILEMELKGSPEWSAVSAVDNQQVYKIPIGFIPWDFYGVEYPLLKLWVAQQLYPDLIKVDMHETTKEFYSNFYNIDLSDTQIDYILKGLAPDGTEFITE